MVSKVKGTQDFLDLSLWNFIINKAKHHLGTYHFNEIATPIVEPTELFKRSLGVQTDVVSKEMFIIKSEKDDDALCLRPEATASTVRAFIENGIQYTPWKVFSYGPMFRYERPQKGRYRQFHQLNIENIGAGSLMHDVQMLTMLDRLFTEHLNLNNYVLLINFLGCFEDRKAYRVVLKEFLTHVVADLCATCEHRKDNNVMRVFDCKNQTCQTIYKKAPFIADHLCDGCDNEWQELQKNLKLLSVSFVYEPKLVRGLDYYNKTVFEFVSQDLGAQNSFCGGGRYDQLVKQLGGKKDQPSLGAAIGLERLMLLLQAQQDSLPLEQQPALHVIMPLSEKQQTVALLLADELHAQNLCTEVLLEGNSVKSMMRTANKLGATYALLIGDDEQQNNEVTLRHMTNSTEQRIKQTEVVAHVKR